MSTVNWLMALVLLLGSVGILISRDWRWFLALLAIQYIAVFWLTWANWPFTLAVVKLITGWTSCTILGLTLSEQARNHGLELSIPQSRFFLISTAGLVGVISLSLASRSATWLGIDLPVIWGSLILIGMGLLQAALSFRPIRVVVSLLLIFSGFEILYASVENSLLVVISLASINFGLSLAGAYLINHLSAEVKE